MSLLTKNKAKNHTRFLVIKLDKSNRGFLTNNFREWESRLGKMIKGDLK